MEYRKNFQEVRFATLRKWNSLLKPCPFLKMNFQNLTVSIVFLAVKPLTLCNPLFQVHNPVSISPFLEEDVEENLWETNKNVQFVKMFNLLAMQLMFSFYLYLHLLFSRVHLYYAYSNCTHGFWVFKN